MNIKKTLSDNKTKILTGTAIGGVATTTVLAAKGGMKAKEELDRITNPAEELTFKDKVKITWKCYIPAACSAIGTMGCIGVAEYCNSQEKVLAVAAAAAFNAALNDYKEAVIETVGEEIGEEVRKVAGQKEIDRTPYTRSKESLQFEDCDEGDYLCYEPLTGRYFRSNKYKIDDAMNEVCREIIAFDEAPLNSLFARIGVRPSELGQVMGWMSSVSKLPKVTYSANMTDDGRPVVWLDYTICPTIL